MVRTKSVMSRAQAILNKYGFTHYKDREAVWTKTINQIKVFVVVSQDCGSGSVEVIKTENICSMKAMEKSRYEETERDLLRCSTTDF